MSAFDIHNTDLKILILSSKVAGAEIWKPAQMLTPASYILLAQMVNYFACNFWTVYLYRDDIINFMKVLNSTGIAVQLSIKFFIAIFSKKKLVEMCDMIKTDIYQKYDSRAEPEGEMVYKYAETFHQILKILILMYFSSFVVVGLYPLYFYLVEGELTLLLMIEYPYANWHTTKGFIVTTFVHIVVYFTGICGLVLADALFIIYLKDIESFSAFICLVMVLTSVFVICINIILAVQTDWYACYSFLLLSFISLSIYFVIGNVLEKKLDAQDMCIITFPWNLLNSEQQKEYLFVVSQLQNSLILTIYGFSPLNFETYMEVLKGLYQFVMVILNFVA
ncbi:conserved hypothetical protein [Culex quinquefasciatus]|uniref:Odorant receptor n=1 Tax=Culex quinquefasciatus TaxID=7176 RepID=B0WGD9_CULQU|nr:conserved hypothetical protein [Culex quinquefasciatus]|eukprot:XP_001847773.1 conserved hypothetical protein [Culex quinquefasciatus]